MLVGGLDEAGRGPVIGPMIITLYVLPEDEVWRLAEIGVRDSKELSPSQREGLFDQLMGLAHSIAIAEVSVSEINLAMDRGVKLTRLEAMVSAYLIDLLKPDLVYIDAASVNIERYCSSIKARLKSRKTSLRCLHRADKAFPIVSAASIISKVVRDRAIRELSKTYGEIGSGYPSDPKTLSFLKEWISKHGSPPPIVRKRWKTLRRLKGGGRTLEEYF